MPDVEGRGRGRRIYIHESSFDHLARQSPVAAQLVLSALVGVPVMKIVRHFVVEDGVAYRGFRKAEAVALERSLADRWGPLTTRLCRSLGYRPAEPRLRQGFWPLLTSREIIAATCYDAQYYTFATSSLAAERMYADVEKMSTVRRLIREGHAEYQDILLIKGPALALVDPEIGTGENRAGNYPALQNDKPVVSPEQLAEIKIATRSALDRDLHNLAVKALSSPTRMEREVIEEFFGAVNQTVERVVLRQLPPEHQGYPFGTPWDSANASAPHSTLRGRE